MKRSTRYRIELDEVSEFVHVEARPEADRFGVALGTPPSSEHAVQVLKEGNHALLLVGSRVVSLSVLKTRSNLLLSWKGITRQTFVDTSSGQTAAPAAGGPSALGVLTAPMPGRIVQIQVREGQTVEQGAVLLVIEAMKMQNALFSPARAHVRQIFVVEGAAIEHRAPLLRLEVSGADELELPEASDESP